MSWLRIGLPALTITGVSLNSLYKFLSNGPCAEMMAKDFGLENGVDDEMKRLISEVYKDFEIDEEKRKRLQFYYNKSLETTRNGMAKSPWKIFIGMAEHTNVWSPEEAEKKIIIYSAKRGAKLDYRKENVSQVIESFYLSEKAKKFLIAREIEIAFSNKTLYQALTPIVSGTPLVLYLNSLLKAQNAMNEYFMVAGLFFFFTLFLVANIIVIHFYIEESNQTRADVKVAKLNNDYFEGAVEYFEKAIIRDNDIQKMSSDKNSYIYKQSESSWQLLPRLLPKDELGLVLKLRKINKPKEIRIT